MLAHRLLPNFDHPEETGRHGPDYLSYPTGDALAAELQQQASAARQDTARALTSLPMDLSQYKEASGEPQPGDLVTPSSQFHARAARRANQGEAIGVLIGFKSSKKKEVVVRWFLGKYKGLGCPIHLQDLVKVEISNEGQLASGDNPVAALEAEKERIEKILISVRNENNELWAENSRLKGKKDANPSEELKNLRVERDRLFAMVSNVEPPEGATPIQEGIHATRTRLINELSDENAALRARLRGEGEDELLTAQEERNRLAADNERLLGLLREAEGATPEQKIVEGKVKFFQEQRDKLYSENEDLKARLQALQESGAILEPQSPRFAEEKLISRLRQLEEDKYSLTVCIDKIKKDINWINKYLGFDEVVVPSQECIGVALNQIHKYLIDSKKERETFSKEVKRLLSENGALMEQQLQGEELAAVKEERDRDRDKLSAMLLSVEAELDKALCELQNRKIELDRTKQESDRLAAEVKGLKLELKQQANGGGAIELKNYRDCQRALVYARIKQAQRLFSVQLEALEWAGKQEGMSDRKTAIETNNRFRAETLGETKSAAIAKEIALFEVLRHDFGNAELTDDIAGQIAERFTAQGLTAYCKIDSSQQRQQLMSASHENTLWTKQQVEEAIARLVSRSSDFLPEEIKQTVANDISGASQRTAEKKLAKMAAVASINETAAKEVVDYLDGVDPKDSEIFQETAKDIDSYGIVLKQAEKLSRELGVEREAIEKAATEALHQNCVREWRSLLEETAAKVKQAKKAMAHHKKTCECMDMLAAATSKDSVAQQALLKSLETFAGNNLRVAADNKVVQLSLFEEAS